MAEFFLELIVRNVPAHKRPFIGSLVLLLSGTLSHCSGEDSETPCVETQGRQSYDSILCGRIAQCFLKRLPVRYFNQSCKRSIRHIDDDQYFFLACAANETDHALLIRVAKPGNLCAAQRGVIASQWDYLFIECWKLRPPFADSPEDWELFKQSRRARFGCVSNLHAVVEQRYAVQHKHKRRCGKRAALPKPGEGAALIVIVREHHVYCSTRELCALLFPYTSDGCRWGALIHHFIQRRMEGPAVIQFKGFDHQIRFRRLGNHNNIRFDLLYFHTGSFPKIDRYLAGDIAAEPIQ